MVIWLKVAWEKVKKYWWIVLAGLGVLVGVFFSGSYAIDNAAKKIADANKAHDEAIKQIKTAANDQRTQTEAAATKLTKTLDAVQEQYASQNKALDDAKKQEITNLITSHDGDQDELLKKLAQATGFPVVLPAGK